MERQSATYRINDQNLALRRQFLRFDDGDVRALASLASWADKHVEAIAAQFYDHQFSFAPTLAFFEAHARKKNTPLADLRRHLERSQAGYLRQIFQEAATGGKFGLEYFERRLKVGKLHNVINLPLKWYLGSYPLYQDLFHAHLKRSFPLRPFYRAKAERALFTVFNYDIQAVCDAFFYDYLESIGLNLDDISVARSDLDVSDAYEALKSVVGQSLQETIRTGKLLGDTTVRMAGDLSLVRGAILDISGTIQQVAGNAQDLARNVDETSSSIEQMTAAVRQVATNTDKLGGSVNETSASIEEMTQSIQQVAGNVSSANEVAGKAARAAEEGHHAVEQTINGMTQINQAMSEVVHVIEGLGKSSAEIGNIIEVIDDIAEQTNLLALNAAIEAARAGEHGRGFAVVADEVRKLAERSGKATSEIADLIKGIQRETQLAVSSTQRGDRAIQDGTQLAKKAGDALSAIVGAVGQVTDLMNQITHSTQEQATAAGLINSAVGNMSALTGQVTVATTEQAAGAEMIVRAVEEMNRKTREVSDATRAQQQRGDEVVHAVESLARVAGELESQTAVLLKAIAPFKQEGAASLGLTVARSDAPRMLTPAR